jgi:hypothetical protein
MDYRIVFLPEVVGDLQQAIDWYNEQQKGLGKKFISSVKRGYTLLKRDPFCIAIKYDEIRCLPVSKFPYTIHYRTEKDSRTVVVFAVYHTSRNPEKWKHRK